MPDKCCHTHQINATVYTVFNLVVLKDTARSQSDVCDINKQHNHSIGVSKFEEDESRCYVKPASLL